VRKRGEGVMEIKDINIVVNIDARLDYLNPPQDNIERLVREQSTHKIQILGKRLERIIGVLILEMAVCTAESSRQEILTPEETAQQKLVRDKENE